MQLSLDQPRHDYTLRNADGASAVVNDRRLSSSFVLAPDRLIEEWPATDSKLLEPGHLEPLMALSPEVILLGTGSRQVFPSAAVMASCLSRGIGLEVMTNAAAARTFNVLAAEERRVVAGFILGDA
ncbi:MAG: COGs COG3737 [uncultured Lysobacter sp.]|uniref:COGs COG3737 n=1 Tax=uncultured Lysobacter sp. TaxID=271060 RepID=A0A6J4L3B1_9GAMM|nr:MAG: COGs COG3737 [uncultured Lysobacter sp.]